MSGAAHTLKRNGSRFLRRGRSLVLQTTTGARSGQLRVAPLAFNAQRREMPNFADYQQKTSRKIPVVVLERLSAHT
jgi:hypothetical protein